MDCIDIIEIVISLDWEKSLHPVMYPTILHFCLFHYIDHTKILVTLMLHFREILLSRDIDKRR